MITGKSSSMKTLSTLYVTLGVLPVWCLKCHAGLRAWVVYRLVILSVVQICVFWMVYWCMMLALDITSRRESVVGWVLCECGAAYRALPPGLLCRKARLPCLSCSTMLFGALSLMIVIIPFAVQRAFPPDCDIAFWPCASSVSTSSVLYLTVFLG